MSITSLARVEVGLAELRSRYNQALGQLGLLEKQWNEKDSALERARADIEVWEQVRALFGKASEFAREQLKTRMEETVTAALQAVFGTETLQFRIVLKTLGGQPAADWEVVSLYGDTEVAGDPQDSRGGGISDVVSLALRLAILELTRPKPGGPVLLDEVGKHISAEFAPNVAAFLQQYARKTGRQVLLITHQSAMAEIANVSYRVTQADGISEVKRQ